MNRNHYCIPTNANVGDFVSEPTTIERDLSALKLKGVLKCEGKDNDGSWIIQKISWH